MPTVWYRRHKLSYSVKMLLQALGLWSWWKMNPRETNVFFIYQQMYLLVLESTQIYIKIHTKMLLHVSVYDHHQGARS